MSLDDDDEMRRFGTFWLDERTHAGTHRGHIQTQCQRSVMIGGGGGREWLGLEEVGYSLSQSNSADLLL